MRVAVADLGTNSTPLLSAAAALHEIGLIAQIARYHRRSLPKASHPEYVALNWAACGRRATSENRPSGR